MPLETDQSDRSRLPARRARRSVFGGPAPPVVVPDLLPRTRVPLVPVNQVRVGGECSCQWGALHLPGPHTPPRLPAACPDAGARHEAGGDNTGCVNTRGAARARGHTRQLENPSAPPSLFTRLSAPPAASEVMVTDDGFRYKRRKRVEEPQARRGPAHTVSSAAPEPRVAPQAAAAALPAAAPYPTVSTHALHEALPPSLGEAERLRLVLDCICKVELHAVQRHFAGATTGPHSTQVQAPLAVADALAEWQAAVGDALSQGALRVAPPLQEGGAPQVQLLARLTAVRDAWKAEHDAWLALEADGDADQRGDAGAAASPQELAARLQQQADAAAAAASRVSADTACGALAAAVEEAQQRLQLQLADMAAVVDGAQALASRGDAACAQLAVVMEAAELAAVGVPDAVLDSPRQLMRALCA